MLWLVDLNQTWSLNRHADETCQSLLINEVAGITDECMGGWKIFKNLMAGAVHLFGTQDDIYIYISTSFFMLFIHPTNVTPIHSFIRLYFPFLFHTSSTDHYHSYMDIIQPLYCISFCWSKSLKCLSASEELQKGESYSVHLYLCVVQF